MGLPLLATTDDLRAWRDSSSADVDVVRAEAILAAASTLVRSVAGRVWVDADGEWEADVTELQKASVQTVVVSVANRVYDNPQGYTNDSETLGSYQYSRTVAAWSAFGLSLTDEERRMISDPVGGIPGLTSIRVVAPAAASGSRYSPGFWELQQFDGGDD